MWVQFVQNLARLLNVVSSDIYASKFGICSPEGWGSRWVSSSLMAGLRGSRLMAHLSSSWELVPSEVLQVCAVTCPVWHLYTGGSDKEPFTLARLPVSPSWNDGTIHRLDAAIQRDLGGHRAGTLSSSTRTDEFMQLSRNPLGNSH